MEPEETLFLLFPCTFYNVYMYMWLLTMNELVLHIILSLRNASNYNNISCLCSDM